MRSLPGCATTRPRLVLDVAALLALGALFSLFDPTTLRPRLELDAGMSALWPHAGPARATHARVRAAFGDDDLLLLAWFGQDLFTPQRLAAWRALDRSIAALPGVSSVESLAGALDVQIEAEATALAPFLETLPRDGPAAHALRARALAHPLAAGVLVAPDGRGLASMVRFEAGLSRAALRERMADIVQASAQAAPDLEQAVTGPLPIRLELARMLVHDLLTVTPLAVLATLGVAALGFRSLRGTLLPPLANGITTLLTLALFHAGGAELNFVTAVLPPVVYVVGFAYAIHVVSAFDRCYGAATARRAAARAALDEVRYPLTLTALTTALAFAALALSPIAAIRVFGLYAALGTVLAWLGAVTIVPAGLVLLPGRPCAARELRLSARCAAALATSACRRRRAIIAAALVLAGGSVLAMTRIEVDTAVLRSLPPDNAVVRDFERFSAAFAGPVPLEVLIESEHEGAFLDPAALRALADLRRALAREPGVGGVYALSDYVGLLHRAIAPAAARADGLPTSTRLVRHLLMLGGHREVGRLVDAGYMRALIHVRTGAKSTAAVNALAARIESHLHALPPGLRGEVTGTTYLTARTVDDLTVGQLHSLAFALAAIGVALAVVFRSLRIGVVALLPNALPILAYFGLLGVLPITLNLTTSLVACAVFGIAVDDTVHFLARYRRDPHWAHDPDRAIAAALTAVLRPVTLTTLALCAGFAALGAAELRAQAEFGLLAALTLALAWLVDLSVTPALFRTLAARRARGASGSAAE